MKQRIRCKGIAWLVLLWMVALASVACANGVWRLDGTGGREMPMDFRTTNDAWHREAVGEEPPRREMDRLLSSASAQPSREGISVLYAKLRTIAPDANKIYLVDLRQESHGFADGIPVSWYEEKNQANMGKNAAEAELDEKERIKALRGVRTTFVPLGNADKARLQPKTFRPKSMGTEREAAEAAGFRYVRFSATDMVWPEDEAVEEFLSFAQSLPEDAWLHFHCQAGHGRTTTFMVMYDILKNSDVALEDVVKRHYLLGGSNLFAESTEDNWYAQMHREREKMLRLFYRYVQEKRTNATDLSWSDWKKQESGQEKKDTVFPEAMPGDLDAGKVQRTKWVVASSLGMPLLMTGERAGSVSLMGPAEATQEQMVRFLKSQNPKAKLSCTPEELVGYYYEEAGREGIRPDIALCQSFKETGFYNYGGDVLPEQNNFCGLGAVGNRVKGAWFQTAQLGVRAHIQHLLAYASTRRPSLDIVDPRYDHIAYNRRDIYGQVTTWTGLNGVWAVPGTHYGQDILNLWGQAKAPDGSEESLRQADETVRQNPQSADAYLMRGIAYANAGRMEEAARDYGESLAHSVSAEAYYNRALCHERMGQEEDALLDYTEAIKVDPEFFQAWYNRANIYLHQGRDSAAVMDFRRSIDLVPQLANAYVGIGIAYLRQGEYAGAWREFYKAGVTNSANEVVKENQRLIMGCLK